MRDTKRLWKMLSNGDYEVVISELTLQEINRCEAEKRNLLLSYLAEITFETVPLSAEIYEVADRFVELGILTARRYDDCLHIAASIVTGCDIITSWNFNHIVNRRTTEGVKIVSLSMMYRDVAIYPTVMLAEGEDDDE